jgi:hypothetical protein
VDTQNEARDLSGMSAWKSQSLSIPPFALSAASPYEIEPRSQRGYVRKRTADVLAPPTLPNARGQAADAQGSSIRARAGSAGPTAVAVDAVEELDGLADVVHVRRHLHEGEARRAKKLLGVLHRAELQARAPSQRQTNVSPTQSAWQRHRASSLPACSASRGQAPAKRYHGLLYAAVLFFPREERLVGMN